MCHISLIFILTVQYHHISHLYFLGQPAGHQVVLISKDLWWTQVETYTIRAVKTGLFTKCRENLLHFLTHSQCKHGRRELSEAVFHESGTDFGGYITGSLAWSEGGFDWTGWRAALEIVATACCVYSDPLLLPAAPHPLPPPPSPCSAFCAAASTICNGALLQNSPQNRWFLNFFCRLNWLEMETATTGFNCRNDATCLPWRAVSSF